MLNSLSFRTVFAALVVFTLTANAFAILFLQQHLGLAPCPLCVTQRAFFLGVTVFAFFGALHNPSGWGRRVYAGLCLLSAGIGGAVSARHV
jgi:disulfide bond formation protein DsbB